MSSRVLYSADPIGLGGEFSLPDTVSHETELSSGMAHWPQSPHEWSAVNDELLAIEQFNSFTHERTEVVFVDTSVADYLQIVNSLIESTDVDVNYIVHTIQSSQSIDQVNTLLSQHQQLDAIHFISHGSDAAFVLGSSLISTTSFPGHANTIAQWGNALSEDGDILFYGCNLAQSTEGQNLVAAIANATNADVGASDNRTGHVLLNADWKLEYSIGHIDTDTSKLESALNDWESQLALQTVTVTTQDDRTDGNTDSITALLNDPGPDQKISLREAIRAADNDAAHDTIIVPAGDYLLDKNDLDISQPLTISGVGPDKTIIIGDGDSRVFEIQDAGQVLLEQLQIKGGNANIEDGGGILTNLTDLSLQSVTLTENFALRGGALFIESGTVSLTDVDMLQNLSRDGGGLFLDSGVLTALNVDIRGNGAVWGGGAFIRGDATIEQSALSANVAGEVGGGVLFQQGSFTLSRSLVDANVAPIAAGIDTWGDITIQDSTLSNNSATNDISAILVGDGKASIERSTIADHTSSTAIFANASADLEIADSLIARNSTISEDITSGGGNVFDFTINNPTPTDQLLVVYPGLSTTLANNGGLIPSYALLPGSPAIDAGSPVDTSATPNITDITGKARSGNIDSGAFEFEQIQYQPVAQAEIETPEDIPFIFSGTSVATDGITIDDSSGKDYQLQVILQVDNGTLELTDNSGLNVVQGDNTASLMIEGLRSDINNALQNGLVYTPDADYTGLDELKIDAVIAADRELYYSFNNRDTTDDNYGTTNDGTLIDDANLDKVFLELDGDNDSIFVESNFNITDELTFSSWIHLDNPLATTGMMTIISINDTVNLRYNPDTTTLTGAFYDPDSSTTHSTDAVVNLHGNPSGENRHHVAYTVNTNTNQQALYVDGLLVAETNHTGSILPDLSSPAARIGGFADSNQDNFDGTIDGVMIFSRAIDAEEIAAIEAAGSKTEAIATQSVNIIVQPENDAPELTSVETTPVPYTENDTPRGISNTLSLADIDDSFVEAATVSISGYFASGEDELLFENQSGITGLYDSANGVLTLSGSATITDYQAAMRSVTYHNLSDDPSVLNRTISFTVDDGDNTSNTVTRDITVAAVNDAPVLGSIELLAASYTENESPIAVTDNLLLSELDDTNIDSASVAISNNFVLGEDELGFINQLGITGSYDSDTGILSLTGSASVADYQTALRAVTYNNTSENPSTLPRTISFEINDGDDNSNIVSRDIHPAAVNDAPALATIEAMPAYYTEDQVPVGITGNLSLEDLDDTNIESAVVSISNNFAAGEDELIFTDQPGITGTYNPTTGILTLTGSATVEDYQTALRAVVYQNTSDNPSTLSRTVSIEINDGELNGNTLSRDITLIAVNDAPALSSTETMSASYTENQLAIPVTETTLINDIDDSQIENATVSITGGFSSGDNLHFADQSGISGFYNSGTGKLTLSGSATLVEYQTAIQSITYDNISDNPSALTRTVSFEINDGDDSSNIATREINFTAVNDAPSLATIEALPASYIEGDSPVGITGNLSLADLDDLSLESAVVSISNNFAASEDELQFTNQAGITGSYDAASGVLTLSGSASVADYQTALQTVAYNNSSANPSTLTRTVSFEINDGDLGSNILSRDIELTGVNDAPVLLSIESQPALYSENDTPVTITGSITVTDVDDTNIETATVSITGNFATAEDQLDFTDQNGIAGNFDPASGTLTLTGSATLAEYQTALRSITYANTSDDPSDLTITVTFAINDGDDNSAFATRDINFTAVNDAPTLSTIEALPAYYTEGTPVGITGNLSIDDPDNTNLESARVSITNNFAPGEDELLFSDQAGITGAYDAATGTLTLTGSASIDDYRTALRAIQYSNTSDNPSTLTRTVSFEINDGDLNSNALSRDIDLTGVNDAPVLSSIESAPALYTENDTPLAITAATTVTDIDDTDIDGAVVSIVSNFISGGDQLAFSSQNGIVGMFDTSSGILTLTGSATLAEYQAAIQSVTYANTSDNPSNLTRTVSFEINDGDDNSNIVSRDIQFTAVNDAPVLATIEALPALFTEGGSPVGITGNLSLDDLDNVNLESAVVSISGNFAGGEDELLFTDQASITGIYNAATGTLTLSGSASVADYQAALQTVAYNNTSDNPSTLTRTVSFEINDGNLTSNILSRDISLTAVNDAPTLASIETILASYTENDTPVAITDNTTVTDVDDTIIELATVSITNNYVSGEDLLNFNDQAGISGLFDTATGTLTLTGSATLAEYQAAIQSVTYANTSDNPSNLNRIVSFEINDGDDNSNTVSREIQFTAVNDAPALSTIEALPALFTEGGSPVGITGNLSLDDLDDVNLESAVVSISGNFAAGEDELLFTDQPSITGSYDAATGILTLSGSASVADYQAALQTVAYNNTSDNPSTLTRTVSFEINDGNLTSNTLNRELEFVAVNDAPTLSMIESTPASFTENDSPMLITSNITLNDVDDTHIENASVSITSNFISGEDQLNFSDQSGITGNFDTTNGILTLTGPATLAEYQTALRSVTYINTSDTPSVLSRTVSFEINDGDDNSNTVVREIELTAINDAPILSSIESAPLSYIENDQALFVTGNIAVSDIDDTNIESASVSVVENFTASEDQLTFTDQPGIVGSYNPATGSLTLTGSASVADYQAALRTVAYSNTSENPSTQTRTIEFSINDGDTNSNTVTRDIDLTAINDAPMLAGIEVPPASYTENDLPAGLTDNLIITDSDDNTIESATVTISTNFVTQEDELSYTPIAGIISQYDAATGTLTLTGNATVADYQEALRSVTYTNSSDNPSTLTREVSFDINDGELNSNVVTREIDITAVNDAPLTNNTSITTHEDTPVTIAFSDLAFNDVDNNTLLEVVVDSADPRLAVNNTAQTITYTPPTDYNGSDSFSFSVRDDGGTDNYGSDTSTPATVSVEVTAVNDSPTTADVSLPSVLEDSSPAGQLISSLVNSVITDVDSTNSLAGVAITSNTELASNGVWQYAIAVGDWQDINGPNSAVSESGALLLDKDTSLRFLPSTDFNGNPLPLTYKAIDNSYTGSFSTETQKITQSSIINSTDSWYSNTAQISATVLAVNDPPTVDDAELDSINEDTTLTTPANVMELFSTGYSDVDGTQELFGIAVTENMATVSEGSWQYSTDQLTWSGIDSVTEAEALLLNKDTLIRFSPAADFHGTPQSLIIRPIDGTYSGLATDSNSTIDRVTIDTTTADNRIGERKTISTRIISVNDAPAANDFSISIVEDTSHVFSTESFGFSDPIDADAFSGITVKSLPVNGTLLINGSPASIEDWITVTDLNLGKLAYMPDEDSNAADTWGFSVSDNGGTLNGGMDQDPITRTVSIDIISVNDAPQGIDTNFGTDESTPIQLSINDFGFSDDTDQDNFKGVLIESIPETGALLLGESLVTQSDIIDSSDIANGLLTFIPAPVEISSRAEIGFKVIDDGGTSNNGNDTAVLPNTITIDIVADNTPPTASNATIDLDEDSTFIFSADTFGFMDSTDNHPMAGVIISSVPTSGALLINGTPLADGTFIEIAELNAGGLSYTPELNESGSNYTDFQFRVADAGKADSGKHISVDEYTLTIHVNSVNDAPTINIDSNLEVAENSSDNSIGKLEFIDVDVDDTHQLTVSDNRFEIIDGALALKPGVTLDFESEPRIPLQVSITDSAGNSVIQNIMLQVMDVNEAPIASQPGVDQSGSAPFSFTIPPAMFTDGDDDPLTLIATLADGSPLPEWLAFENGQFNIANSTEATSVDVVITATDPEGLSVSSPLSIFVEPVIAAAQTLPSAPVIELPTIDTATPEVVPMPQEEIIEETAEEDSIKPSDPDSPPEDPFEANAIDVRADVLADQQISEVVQIGAISTTKQVTLTTRDDFGIELANEFDLLLDTETLQTETTRQQLVFNAATLQNLAVIADRSETQLSGSTVLSPTVLATSVSVSSTLSVGYILWLLRGGTLLASVMASMPAWRTIDPLPILESLTGEDNNDTETLESMVQESEAKHTEATEDKAA